MRTLLRDLGTVNGVQCACIVRGGQVLASSFPEADAVAQATSLGFVRGVSDGLELVDRGFEELLIDFDGKSLMVAPVDKDFVLAMLATPEANVSLLRVVLGSSVRQLRRMHDVAQRPEPVVEAKPQPAAVPPPPPKPAAAAPVPPKAAVAQPSPPAPAPQASRPQATGRPQPAQQSKPAPPPPPPLKGQQQAARPTPPPQAQAKPQPKPEPQSAAAKVADRDAEPILPQILGLLTEYIGPVARVSFKRGVTRWRETSTPTVGTLGDLARILAADLSSDGEKKAFLDAVERLKGA